MKEVEAKQYYIHKSYANVYYYIYIALEKWIANNIFRKDLSRVFLSSNEYAFRRRYELTDMSLEYDDLKVSDLQFPFANYWPQNTGWQADKRPAGVTAKMAYLGVYEGNTKIKAIPSVLSIPVTFYFDREDDARMAYEILYFKSFNEHYYEQQMPYGTNTLNIPVNIEINNLNFNPTYKETDWLKDNRLFLITANLDVRSFAILPPLQPDFNSNINEASDDYEDGIINYYLTEKVILNPISDPATAAAFLPREEGEDQASYEKRLEDYILTLNKNFMDLATVIVDNSGQAFQSDIEAALDFESLSENSLKVKWIVSQNESFKKEDFLNKITIEIPSKKIKEDLDPSKSSYILSNLKENSQYLVYVTFYSKTGSPKKLGIIAKTLPSKKPVEDTKNSLVGLSW